MASSADKVVMKPRLFLRYTFVLIESKHFLKSGDTNRINMETYLREEHRNISSWEVHPSLQNLPLYILVAQSLKQWFQRYLGNNNNNLGQQIAVFIFYFKQKLNVVN